MANEKDKEPPQPSGETVGQTQTSQADDAKSIITSPSRGEIINKAMKTPQGLNNAMFSLNMTAILLGIRDNTELNIGTPLLFTVFFILLRIKIYLDDSKFLEDGKIDDRPLKKWGYLTSIFTWLLFSFSAYRINTKPEWSFWFFISAIVMSTIWIAPIQIKVKFKDKKHNVWLFSNIVYSLGAFALLHIDKDNICGRSFIFGALFLMLLIDTIISNPLEHFDT
jgi:hypothetical protein